MYFDDLKIGMAVNTEPAVIEKEKMLAFARDYDNIPLHTNEEYAKKTPFGKLIAPGVMSFMSVWAKYLEVDFFGEELLAGKSTKIEWLTRTDAVIIQSVQHPAHFRKPFCIKEMHH